MHSFIIPAHNEEALIGRTIESINDAVKAGDHRARPFEVIVADDASTDATRQVAERAGARVVSVDRRQIAAARNAGAAAARGDVFIFVDADTMITGDVYRATVAALDDGAVGGGALVKFDPPVPRYVRVLLPLVMRINRTFRMAAGCYVYATRDAFTEVGGFDERVFVAEEVFFSRAMHRHGRFEVVRAAVRTSGRKLRAHSAAVILGTTLKFGVMSVFGHRAFGKRERFDLWYAPRREDPAANQRDGST